MSVDERVNALVKRGFLDAAEAGELRSGNALLPVEVADRMVENVIGVFGLPFAVAPNFVVNGRDHVVPMVVEEPSVVAAVSSAARLIRDSGGFTAKAANPVLIGQVQVVGIEDPDRAVQSLFARQRELIECANALQPRLVARGGGARAIEFFKYRLPDEDWTVVLHLLVDTRDAMGANLVNTMCEGVAPLVTEICGGDVVLRILSNLADKSLVRVKANIALKSLATGGRSAEFVRDSIVLANDFANADPYRAATHNKGIMNGVSAVVLATGNDTRAVEAGAHAFAARTGRYRSLSSWEVTAAGDLAGTLELPLAVGLVGGAVKVHPTARALLAILQVQTAAQLARIIAAVGLAQNFGAMKALATEGIQKGHMSLHAQNVAFSVGAVGKDVAEIARLMVERRSINEESAVLMLAELRDKR